MTATAVTLSDPMAAALDFVTLDVFTEQCFAGNPLAVVLGADGLSDGQMQVIAREFNLSETIFVMAPRQPGNTARVRIFLPNAEIPFAGHPTIGCAIHLGLAGRDGSDFAAEIRLEEEAGLVPVRIWRQDGKIGAELTAPVIPHAPRHGALPDPALVAAAVGLPESEIGIGAQRIGLWQGGPGFLYVPLASLDALARARPCEPQWSQAMQTAAVDSAYLYTPGAGDCDYQARLFSPGAGIAEDPATGSASAILAAQLLAHGQLAEGENRLSLRQGVEMGRPSRIGLRVQVTDGQIQWVKVQGSAVPISKGQIRRP